jgi:cation diffusion facilitator CzcD-associated flavoprotein CzcO
VIRAEWISADNKWEITVKPEGGQAFKDRCDVFINAGGVLNAWKWPDIQGLHSFKGDLCHTARWPQGLDLRDKRVAIVGSGSSGIQLLATVQPEAKKIYHWIRM